MKTVIVLLVCTASPQPFCTEYAMATPGWAECVDALEQHAVRVPEPGSSQQVVLVTCAEGEPGVRGVSLPARP